MPSESAVWRLALRTRQMILLRNRSSEQSMSRRLPVSLTPREPPSLFHRSGKARQGHRTSIAGDWIRAGFREDSRRSAGDGQGGDRSLMRAISSTDLFRSSRPARRPRTRAQAVSLPGWQSMGAARGRAARRRVCPMGQFFLGTACEASRPLISEAKRRRPDSVRVIIVKRLDSQTIAR